MGAIYEETDTVHYAAFRYLLGAAVAEDQIEEVVVLGEVLFQDQINALKTPTPVINVPQSVGR